MPNSSGLSPPPGVDKMPSGLWKAEQLDAAWYYAKWWVAENQAFILIVIGSIVAISVVMMVINLLEPDDDDHGFDYEEY